MTGTRTAVTNLCIIAEAWDGDQWVTQHHWNEVDGLFIQRVAPYVPQRGDPLSCIFHTLTDAMPAYSLPDVVPVQSIKGLPKNTCAETRKACARYNTIYWATCAEINAIRWEASVALSYVATPRQVQAFKRTGTPPYAAMQKTNDLSESDILGIFDDMDKPTEYIRFELTPETMWGSTWVARTAPFFASIDEDLSRIIIAATVETQG